MNLKLIHNMPLAKEVYVHINIATAYKMGEGWTKEEQDAFVSEVHPKIINAGYKLTYPDDYGRSVSGSPTISKRGNFSRMDLYLHPMEISGYATIEDIDKIVEILKSCECISRVGTPQIRYVYDASDSEYRNALIANSKQILAWIRENQNGIRFFSPGSDFAEKYRIPRVGDKSVFCSSDTDWMFVDTLAKVADVLGI